MLEQKEDIELTRSFYPQILGSNCFSDITLFCNITLFGNVDSSRIKQKLQSQPLPCSFLQESHLRLTCIVSKREGKQIQDGGTFLFRICKNFITYFYLHPPTSTYSYIHLPTSTYTYLHLPTSTYIYLHSDANKQKSFYR